MNGCGEEGRKRIHIDQVWLSGHRMAPKDTTVLSNSNGKRPEGTPSMAENDAGGKDPRSERERERERALSDL
jgi:hypothetical protein